MNPDATPSKDGQGRRRVRIFDTTLRDGEQSPGVGFTIDEKTDIAHQLVRLGVDVIEAGFPAASPGDKKAVERIAWEAGNSPQREPKIPPVICGLARAVAKDIETTWEAVRHAEKPRIHTFLGTSEIHMKAKLGMSRAQVIDRIDAMVKHARDHCEDVEFSPEDASRTDPEFLVAAVATAIEAGATTINIPDTVGYATPAQFQALLAFLKANVPRLTGDVVLSVHCHDDLGLATANTLSGVEAGAGQIEVAINGIGERAGNTPLEEAVMALKTRAEFYQVECRVDPAQLIEASRLVSAYTGFPVPPNKAIVGDNAFAHESGIHQAGVLKNPATYEIIDPTALGAISRIVLGKHSGRHALRHQLEALGHRFNPDEINVAFIRFKELADQKTGITQAELQEIASTIREGTTAKIAPGGKTRRAHASR